MIVTNTEAQRSESLLWKVSETPRTVIGSADGPTGLVLYRAFSSVVREDGTVLIGNGGTNEIYVIDSTGRFVDVIGGEGGGPGEFRHLLRIMRAGSDSIIAAEASGVMHVFRADGEFGRRIHPDLAPGAGTYSGIPHLLGVFDSGALLVSPYLRIPTSAGYAGPYRDTLYLSIFSPDGRLVRSLGQYLGREMYWHQDDSRRVSFSVPVPHGRQTFVIAARDRLYVVDNRHYEIQVRSALGELRLLIRMAHLPAEMRQEEDHRLRDAMHALLAASDASDGARTRFAGAMTEALANLGSPDVLPPIQGVKIDTEGCIWVREYGRRPPEPNWTVFGPDGILMARVTLPSQLEVYWPAQDEIHEIGRDYVIGRVVDQDNTEFIHMYRLVRQ